LKKEISIAGDPLFTTQISSQSARPSLAVPECAGRHSLDYATWISRLATTNEQLGRVPCGFCWPVPKDQKFSWWYCP